MNGPLPRWVIELVAAIQESEENHPRYYADFAIGGMQPLDECPESRFLTLIPRDVRETARRSREDQPRNPTVGLWDKRNTSSGHFEAIKRSGDVFKGVKREN